MFLFGFAFCFYSVYKIEEHVRGLSPKQGFKFQGGFASLVFGEEVASGEKGSFFLFFS